MTTSAWTHDHLARLELAIAKGVQTVQYEDRRTTYRTLDEMVRLRDLIRRDLGISGAGKSERRRLARYSKDL